MALTKNADSQATRDAIAELASGAQATATNDSAAAGNVGQYVESKVAVGSAVALTTATPANVTSISLTAGDWTVHGLVNYAATTATVTARQASVNSTSATQVTDGTEGNQDFNTTTLTHKASVGLSSKRVSLAATTTIYLVAQATFSAGSVAAYGQISARRVR